MTEEAAAVPAAGRKADSWGQVLGTSCGSKGAFISMLGSGGRLSRLRARADDAAWRTSAQVYLQELLDTGECPNLAELGA
jgi:hypothetical protein